MVQWGGGGAKVSTPCIFINYNCNYLSQKKPSLLKFDKFYFKPYHRVHYHHLCYFSQNPNHAIATINCTKAPSLSLPLNSLNPRRCRRCYTGRVCGRTGGTGSSTVAGIRDRQIEYGQVCYETSTSFQTSAPVQH